MEDDPKSKNDFAVVVLAAGRGVRMNAHELPKVMLPIGGKPILAHTVEILLKSGFAPEQICVVVGFQGECVREFFGSAYLYAYQAELKGTAHAAYIGMRVLPDTARHVLVLGGDDGAFYMPGTVCRFISQHTANNAVISVLTADAENPSQFGRVVRMEDGAVRIVEKEYVLPEHAHINEVSTGTFCFDRAWFESAFPDMPILQKLGEYGLPTAVAFANTRGERVNCVKLDNPGEWFGINTSEELQEADRRKQTLNSSASNICVVL